MNILQLEDLTKGLPDSELLREAKQPSGQVPQFLVISEIQRRQDMRKRYKADQQQMPQQTVAEKIVQQGIGSLAGGAASPSAAPQIPPPAQHMAGGGIVHMDSGGYTSDVTPRWPTVGTRGTFNVNPYQYNPLLRNLEAKRRQDERDALYQEMIPGLMINQRPPPYSLSGILGVDDMSSGKMPGSVEVQGSDARVQSGAIGEAPSGTSSGTATVTGGGTGSGGIDDLLSGNEPPGINKNEYLDMLVGKVGQTPDTGIDFSSFVQRMSAEPEKIQAFYNQLAQEEVGAYPDLSKQIADQRKDAWAGAMVQLGAGIAGNDLSGGIQRAGILGLRAKEQARELEMQQALGALQQGEKARQLRGAGFTSGLEAEDRARAMELQGKLYHAEQETKNFDRDVQILGQAAAILAQRYRSKMDYWVQQSRDDNETMRLVKGMVSEVMDKATIIPTADDYKRYGQDQAFYMAKMRAVSQLYDDLLPDSIKKRRDLRSFVQATMQEGSGTGTTQTGTTPSADSFFQ